MSMLLKWQSLMRVAGQHDCREQQRVLVNLHGQILFLPAPRQYTGQLVKHSEQQQLASTSVPKHD